MNRGAAAGALALALLIPGLLPAAAAALSIPPGSVSLELLDTAGQPELRAGAHPDRLLQRIRLEDVAEGVEDPKEFVIDLPAGLGGDPGAVPFCPRRVISETGISGELCPADAQVGTIKQTVFETEYSVPLYNVAPGPDETVVFGAFPAFAPVFFYGSLRPGDQGISLRLPDIGQSPLAPRDMGIELWGVPADHQEGTAIPRRPLLSLPGRCGDVLTASVSVRTWQRPGTWVTGTGAAAGPLGGCEQLPFAPAADLSLDNPVADSPTGARIELTVPQGEDPDGRASAAVKEVSVLLPAGMTVSPGGASRLRACDEAAFGPGSASPPACPASSRVGSLEIGARGLAQPLRGALYLGRERPGDRFRVLAAASGPGVEVKLTGSLRADPLSGRLTARLADLPEVAFERLVLGFDGGRDALLATPLACGPAPAEATIVPYGGAPAHWQADVAIAAAGGGCAGAAPFAPGFSGGSSGARAGRPTAFTTTIRRRDGEQLPSLVAIDFPPGMSAALGTVARCAAQAAAVGDCPATARIGSAVAELGPGPEPARLDGRIYLTGPYRRAPFGLAIVFAAALGPFDFGSTVVRGALEVDPLSGRVSVRTDPLPRLLEGVPVRFQAIGLDVDRPGFLRNPTSCGPSEVGASLRSSAGAAADLSVPFAVRGCIDLPFRPAFRLGLTGSREALGRGGRPGLLIAARQRPDSAGIAAASASLPPVLRFDASGLRALCARAAARRGRCPEAARVGSGLARTPLLGEPLRGPIYVVQPHGDGTPDLWADLAGEGLEVRLRAQTGLRDGRLRTRLVGLPDFPLRSFALRLAGGPHGVMALRADACRADLRAPLSVAGRNGARLERRLRLSAGGCGG